jgi:hypothetical protein
MPAVASWDRKWSGDGALYALTRRVSDAKADHLDDTRHTYHFGDGWVAAVNVSRVAGEEARKIRRRSQGFCGYEWMVDSILVHGDIRCPEVKSYCARDKRGRFWPMSTFYPGDAESIADKISRNLVRTDIEAHADQIKHLAECWVYVAQHWPLFAAGVENCVIHDRLPPDGKGALSTFSFGDSSQGSSRTGSDG